MYDSSLHDPWPDIARNGGYTPEFLARARAKAEEQRKAIKLAREREAMLAKTFLEQKQALERQLRAEKSARNKLLRRGAPKWVRDLLITVAREANLPAADVLGPRRHKELVQARKRLFYAIKVQNPRLSYPAIAQWFERDHTGVIHAVACHAAENGLPKLTTYNLDAHIVRRRDRARRQWQ